MNDQHTKYLYDKYPNLFADKDQPMTVTAMCWGFDCGDGWFKLIDDLCDKITKHCEENCYDDIKAVQVKEKWGTLRFYLNYSDDTIEQFIWDVERESAKICSICGEPYVTGDVHQGAVCVKCREKYLKNNFYYSL